MAYGLGEGGLIPTLQDLSVSLAPEAQRGAVVALFVSSARLGQTVGPLGAAALYFVGKHSTCAVQLEHPSVSRRHAVLLRDKVRGLLVVDLASKARAACAWATS